MRILLTAACALTATTCLQAVDGPPLADTDATRLAAEVLLGSPGFEAGVAGEFRWHNSTEWQIRPELFINEDERVGAAVSLSWDLAPVFTLPAGHELFLGPRVAYHNSDHSKWGFDAMALYSFPLFPDREFRHNIEIMGTVGILQHRDDSDKVSSRFGASLGVGYAYRF